MGNCGRTLPFQLNPILTSKFECLCPELFQPATIWTSTRKKKKDPSLLRRRKRSPETRTIYIIYYYLQFRSDKFLCLTMTCATTATFKKPKKSNHDKLSTQAVQLENTFIAQAGKPKKKKAREHPEQQHDTSQKKGKKRKKIDAEEQMESMENKAQSEAEGESLPPKKKHKNRTNFADPREDTQLNTQSRKGAHYGVALSRLDGFSFLSTALEYVFTQLNRPSRWKFNKARQNWLIRNVWSSETVS